MWGASPLGRLECDLGLEGGAPGGPAERPEEGRTEGERQDDGHQGPAEIPAEGRGQAVRDETGQVGGDAGVRVEGDVRGEGAHEGPAGHVHGGAVGEGGEEAVRREEADLGPAPRPLGARQQARAHREPAHRQHLERHPRSHPTGEQGGREHRDVAEREAEAGAEDPPAEHHQEEHRLDAGRPRADRSECGAGRGEYPEHGHGLGAEPRLRDRRRDHRDEEDEESREEPGGVLGVRADPGGGRGEEGPAEGDDAHGADQSQGEQGTGAQAYGSGHGRAFLTWVTVSHRCGARILLTCGAKEGEAVMTSAAGPSAITSPSASRITRWASSAASSTSWVANMIAWPVAASSLSSWTRRALAAY